MPSFVNRAMLVIAHYCSNIARSMQNTWQTFKMAKVNYFWCKVASRTRTAFFKVWSILFHVEIFVLVVTICTNFTFSFFVELFAPSASSAWHQSTLWHLNWPLYGVWAYSWLNELENKRPSVVDALSKSKSVIVKFTGWSGNAWLDSYRSCWWIRMIRALFALIYPS